MGRSRLKKRRKPRNPRLPLLVLGALITVFSAVVLGFYLHEIYLTLRFEHEGVQAQAAVTRTRVTYSRSGNVHWVHYRYRDASGAAHDGRDFVREDAGLAESMPVAILYLPTEPGESRLAARQAYMSQRQLRWMHDVPLYTGSAMLLGGLLMFYARRRAAKPDDIFTSGPDGRA